MNADTPTRSEVFIDAATTFGVRSAEALGWFGAAAFLIGCGFCLGAAVVNRAYERMTGGWLR